MNRDQKLNFIKENHPKLFKSLEENVPNAISNIWGINLQEIGLYNSWIAFYCGELGDSVLMNSLLI